MFHVEYLLIAESLKRIFISSLHGDPLQSFMIAWMERFSICRHSHSRIFEHLDFTIDWQETGLLSSNIGASHIRATWWAISFTGFSRCL